MIEFCASIKNKGFECTPILNFYDKGGIGGAARLGGIQLLNFVHA